MKMGILSQNPLVKNFKYGLAQLNIICGKADEDENRTEDFEFARAVPSSHNLRDTLYRKFG